jgi:hypothetical protein
MNVTLGQLLIRERIVSPNQLAAALEQQRTTGQRLGEAMVQLGFVRSADLVRFFASTPPVPHTVLQCGLSEAFLIDLMLKVAFFHGQTFSLQEMSRSLCLPVAVVNELAGRARTDRLIAVKSGGSYSRMSYVFALTDLGMERVQNALQICQYAGAAPVPLSAYQLMVAHQSVRQVRIDAEAIRKALGQLVISEELLAQLGPAFNSGRSIFLYGPAGSGKSVIAESLGHALEGSVFVPYAVEVDGQVIRLFDPAIHRSISGEDPAQDPLDIEQTCKHDPRWVACHRPVVLVGGELGINGLDLEYDAATKFYEAPPHMKAANGIFIIDDFGRQRVPPQQLLNRWIVPLERGTDFLELHTGKKLEIPFDQITVFCTNLKPGDLVDEAFLRRIRHKIEIVYLSEAQFLEILRRVCSANGIEYTEDAARHLVEEHYRKRARPFVGSHPRDLVDQIIDRARYARKKPGLTAEAIDAAAANYFVTVH